MNDYQLFSIIVRYVGRIQKMKKKLSEIWEKDDDVHFWFILPDYFMLDGKIPYDLIIEGKIDVVENVVDEIYRLTKDKNRV